MAEQDSSHGDELPTYDDLAAQHGPNSRFGRWKSWVEKRAAERYAEDTPERQQARRDRGWGPHVDTQDIPNPSLPQVFLSPPDSASTLSRTQTVFSSSSHPDVDQKLQPSTPRITVSQALPPSHLRLNTFGSRFLPHSELPILCLLPLFNHEKLLIGHMDGLTLLDMAPEASLTELDSIEPRRRDIWRGEGVYQLELLEHEQTAATVTPQGVVLALVGAEPPEGASEKDSKEPIKVIRMYNLASLASITSWAAARKDPKPLDLSRPNNWQPQQPSQPKKHKHRLSISRGLKSLKSNETSPSNQTSNAFLAVPSSPPPPPPPPKDSSSPQGDSTESWDVVDDDDLPLRWAADYVPLASPSSRLANQSVLFFELYRSTDQGRVTARLAIATRQNILLYETVRGERAFRFVKEFYTPIPARSATFIYQTQHDSPTHSHARIGSSPVAHSATYPRSQSLSAGASPSSRRASSPISFFDWPEPLPSAPPPPPPPASGPPQLSLFVVFEKKAGIIRIADSAVGEIDLWEDKGHARRVSGSSPISAGSPFRRSIGSLEGLSSSSPTKGPWAPPAEITVPLTPRHPDTATLYLLTRGRHTHIVPSPLPKPLAAHAPLKLLKWGMRPTRVVPRVCGAAAPFLQVTALGEDGVEVQEFALAFLEGRGKGKGKARARDGEDDAVAVVQAEVGPGGAGFLCVGGHWSEADAAPALRRRSTASTVDTVDLVAQRARETGFYAWTQKGYDDWRVFWLGGDAHDEDVQQPMSP